MRPCEHRPSALRRARPARPYAAALLALAALLASLLPSAATAQAPTIQLITIAGTPGSDQTHDRGGGITAIVNFGNTRRVSVTGSPRLKLNIGDETRYMVLLGGHTAHTSVFTLTFLYEFQFGDLDANGISIPKDPIELNYDDITSTITLATDSAVNAVLTYAGLSDQSGHKVDATGEYLDYSAAPSALTVGTTITPLTATPLGFTSGVAVTYAVTTGAPAAGPGTELDHRRHHRRPDHDEREPGDGDGDGDGGQRDGDRGHHLPGGVGAHPGHRARRGGRGDGLIERCAARRDRRGPRLR